MFDFWFTLGTSIIDNGFLGRVKTGTMPFKPILRRLVIEVDAAGNTVMLGAKNLTAGVLDKAASDGFRQNVRASFSGNTWVPPISIYAAGRLSQLLVIKSIGFEATVAVAQAAYGAAQKGHQPPTSPAFPAAIGVCLIDQNLAVAILNSPNGNVATSFFKEFGLTSDETLIIQAYVAYEGFIDQQNRLLTGLSTPWQDICPDQYRYWDPQNAHAII